MQLHKALLRPHGIFKGDRHAAQQPGVLGGDEATHTTAGAAGFQHIGLYTVCHKTTMSTKSSVPQSDTGEGQNQTDSKMKTQPAVLKYLQFCEECHVQL